MVKTVVFLLFLGLVLASAHAQGTDSAQIAARREAFLAALIERDAAKTAGFFAEEGVMHTADLPPVRGRDAIRRFYARLLAFLVSSTVTSERVQASGDMAYETGAVRNVFRSAKGEESFEGKYMFVWVREQGDWHIAAYAVSSNKPGP